MEHGKPWLQLTDTVSGRELLHGGDLYQTAPHYKGVHSRQSSASPHHSVHPSSPAREKGVRHSPASRVLPRHSATTLLYSPVLCPRNPPSQEGRKAEPEQVAHVQQGSVMSHTCMCINQITRVVCTYPQACAVWYVCMHVHTYVRHRTYVRTYMLPVWPSCSTNSTKAMYYKSH